LKALDVNENIIVWMGHSTFYLQLGGRRILTDPVFSNYASPLFFINKAFPGSNVYTAADMPDIDVLVLSHDHWDHLDYPTIMSLKPKIREIVCPLGVGEYFEQWGFALKQLHEEDWFSEVKLADDFSIHVLPSQHFSGRFLQRNATEWASFAFVTRKHRVFFSGDGGYGAHFKEIGRRFGKFDLAIMENGQYNERWHRIHLMPKETVQAAEDIGAKTVISAHSGKFALARHGWNASYRALVEESRGRSYEVITPQIGELAYIGANGQNFDYWWEKMK
jgi:L-ascorbate metabolism protein UlaG (beta-lactamase superfamily)